MPQAQCKQQGKLTSHFDCQKEMCQYDTDAPAQDHFHRHLGILQKMKLKKEL